jgi:site-specific recombinase XerC
VVVSGEVIDAMLEAAKPSLRLFILLCSDMALRSGVANKLSGLHYDAQMGVCRFRGKGQACQTLPATEEIREVIDGLDHGSRVPYVWQLRAMEDGGLHPPSLYDCIAFRRDFTALSQKLGVDKRIIPHDLRRTTAVNLYEQSKDLRTVQALLGHTDLKTTLWYLDHDATPVSLDLLETIKCRVSRKEKIA